MGLLEDLQKQKMKREKTIKEQSPLDMHEIEMARHEESGSEASTEHMKERERMQKAMRKAFKY